MNDKISEIIESFKSLKVLVIGDAILDTYVKGAPDRVSREAPVLVFNVDQQEHFCGGAANTAINVADLGADTYFLTVLGKDAAAKELTDVLKKHKVHTDYVIKDKSRATIAKKRITADTHMLIRIDEGTATDISESCEEELLSRFEEVYAKVDAVILSDYGFGLMTEGLVAGIEKITTANRKIVVADGRDVSKFSLIKPDAVKPNYDETVKLLDIEKASHDRDKQVEDYVDQMHQITGSDKVAVTLDADGVLFLEKGKQSHRIPCIPHENNKAIGAGDTFISAMTLALASGAEGNVAAEIGAAAAAVVVEKDGTVSCSNYELRTYFAPVPKFITQVGQLRSLVKELKRQGKRIVFTNGCFDIIHKGHITLLNKASEAGDVLIVGVNSDNSIRRLKGADRPINNLEDRVTVLAGLQTVNFLVSFDEESPVQLIKEVHPDVYVKGGTYTESNLPETPLLKKLGCELKIVPYINEHSTTTIINRIKDNRSQADEMVA